MPFSDDLRSFATAHDLAVYGATWCPDCRRLDALFEKEKVRHRAIDIEIDEAAAEKLVKETGKTAIPVILVDGKAWVRGYQKELIQRLDGALLVRELHEAAAKV